MKWQGPSPYRLALSGSRAHYPLTAMVNESESLLRAIRATYQVAAPDQQRRKDWSKGFQGDAGTAGSGAPEPLD